MSERSALRELLILDDFGIKPMVPQQFQDLYDILDERGEGKATIVTTQVPIVKCSPKLGSSARRWSRHNVH